MAGRPGTLPWNFATFSGNEPVTTLSDNFSFLNNQINDSGAGSTNYAADTGTANNLIVTLASPPVAYEIGMMVCTTPAFINSGPSVINVNALGNVPIVNPANIALQGGELSLGALVPLVYDGTSFRITGPCALSVVITTASASISVECAGYSSISVVVTWSHVGFVLVLNHLSTGVPITVLSSNASGSNTNFGIQGTNSANGAIVVFSLASGSATGTSLTPMGGAGMGQTNGTLFLFNGDLSINGTLYLAR